MLLDEFWHFNGIENLIHDRSDDSVSKYINSFEYKWNAAAIWAIVEMVMILNHLDFDNSHFTKFKIVIMSTLAYISPAINLYLNPFTYLETTKHTSWFNPLKYSL